LYPEAVRKIGAGHAERVAKAGGKSFAGRIMSAAEAGVRGGRAEEKCEKVLLGSAIKLTYRIKYLVLLC